MVYLKRKERELPLPPTEDRPMRKTIEILIAGIIGSLLTFYLNSIFPILDIQPRWIIGALAVVVIVISLSFVWGFSTLIIEEKNNDQNL
jgi:hypothetical protein